jgi:hypothetical protein
MEHQLQRQSLLNVGCCAKKKKCLKIVVLNQKMNENKHIIDDFENKDDTKRLILRSRNDFFIDYSFGLVIKSTSKVDVSISIGYKRQFPNQIKKFTLNLYSSDTDFKVLNVCLFLGNEKIHLKKIKMKSPIEIPSGTESIDILPSYFNFDLDSPFFPDKITSMVLCFKIPAQTCIRIKSITFTV